jgi:hypothetical protein
MARVAPFQGTRGPRGATRTLRYPSPVLRPSRVPLLLAAALVTWLFADLYLRVELPLAAAMLHLAFRAAAACAEWLEGGEGGRPAFVAATALALGAVAIASGRWGGWLRSTLGLPLFAGQLGLVVIAALMERGLFAGIVVGALLGLRLDRRTEAPPSEPRSRPIRWALGALGLATAAGSLLWLSELMAARSEGYPVVEWLATQSRGGLPLGWILLGIAAALGALAVGLGARDRWWCGPAAAVVAALVGLLLDPGLPLLSAAIVAPAGAWIVLALWRATVVEPPRRTLDPATWPARASVAVLVGCLLIGHTYAVRVFGCSAEPEHPALTRVAEPGEVFRVAVGARSNVAVMSLRTERRFGRVELGEPPGELGFADPGPIPSPPADWGAFPPGTSLASAEELLYAPADDRFYGTVLGGHPDFYSLPGSPSNVVNNLIVTLAPDGSRVTDAVGIEHLCWIGAMAWHDADRRLYIGCEYEAALHRYDPATGRLEASVEDERLGDVAAIALDPTPGSDRLFTVSFWSSQAVAELSRSTLEVRQRRDVGGAHYDLAFDPAADRLFLSSYYGSRVRILAGPGLERAGRVATGLGARALAVAPSRDLLLASSVYDGALTVCRSSDGARIERLHVGGHVKDIAVDDERGFAWFWSQCGLFRLDLSKL